jgi:PHD/YefM family antitoxin component YafN of YafNO toxin-antitoxin module
MCTQVYTITMNPQTISTREFRMQLSKYLEHQEPLAISKHGRTIGYYIPAQNPLEQQELEALKIGVQKLQSLLAAQGINEDDVVAEFNVLRKQKP